MSRWLAAVTKLTAMRQPPHAAEASLRKVRGRRPKKRDTPASGGNRRLGPIFVVVVLWLDLNL